MIEVVTLRERAGYIAELDGVRAVAMLAVVLFHYEGAHIGGGYLGVSVFFVLSGFLITGLLAHERESRGAVDLRAFYIRRALRLYPALIVTVVLFWIVAQIVGHAGVSGAQLTGAAVASLLYVNDFAMATGHFLHRPWFGVTWSLGVEEQFYLLWPLVLGAALARGGRRDAGRWCLIAAVVIGVLYVPLRMLIGTDWMTDSPIGSLCALLLGCGIALADIRLPRRLSAAAGAVLLVLFIAAPGHNTPAAWYGIQQLAAVCAGAVIADVAHRPSRLLGHPVLVWFGRRSYGIYLIHYAVYFALINATSLSGSKLTAVGIPLSVLLAALSYRFVETPFLRLKRTFARTDREALAV